MLQEINLKQKMEKKEYKEKIKHMEGTLAHLQQQIRQVGVPVVLVFEGWSASGKGTYISRVVNPLDPRYFDVRTTGKLTEDKQLRPFLWSYWTYLPPKGQIVIMDKSWHRLIVPNVRDDWKLSVAETHGFYVDVNAFERQLTDEGYLIIKFFLHISKKEQLRRFNELENNPDTAWRNKPHDWKQNENYEQNLHHFEKMLRMTATEQNPWHIIEAEDKRFATHKIMGIIINALETQIKKQFEKRLDDTPPPIVSAPAISIPKTLQSINPNESLADGEYRHALESYQERMRILGSKLYARRRSAVIVYEGWDAAGKGGNIKRLVSEIDPRCYAVVPVGPPRAQELARHYLWRFMVKMPKDGHLTIFDRSWYGRVLVERVDKLTPEHIWQRAYQEINEMEQHLASHGTVILKFWMHIDKAEQLRRFESRQNNPLKQHKITDDDWHNRENWDAYEVAADEMFARTHTPHAPWIVVESNSKKYARIKVLQAVTDALDAAMH